MPQLQGRIYHIGKTEQVTDNFSKREFILQTEATTQWSQFIRMECQNKKIELLDKVKEGDNVSVDFNLQGRLDRNKKNVAYNTLSAWKIEKV